MAEVDPVGDTPEKTRTETTRKAPAKSAADLKARAAKAYKDARNRTQTPPPGQMDKAKPAAAPIEEARQGFGGPLPAARTGSDVALRSSGLQIPLTAHQRAVANAAAGDGESRGRPRTEAQRSPATGLSPAVVRNGPDVQPESAVFRSSAAPAGEGQQGFGGAQPRLLAARFSSVTELPAFRAELGLKPPQTEPQTPPMPGPLTALGQGVFAGGRDLANTGSALAGGKPGVNADSSPAAAPMQWGDLSNPSNLFAKLAFQMGQSWPTVAGGVAGTGIGMAAAGGPENPVAWVTGLAGGAIGAGMMNGLQTFGNYFGEELRKTPGDADGAYNRALTRATASGVFSGAAWAAFPARAFQGPLKNLMFQAFGVQPGVNMAHQATDNALTGQPVTQNLGQAYAQGAANTAAVKGGHVAGAKAGAYAGRYKLQFDPKAFGANGGNVRIVPREQAAAEFRQASKAKPDDPFPTNTTPTGPIGGKPFGEPETVKEKTTEAEDKRGVRAQNEALDRLADAGYRVVRHPTETKGSDGKPVLSPEQLSKLGLKPNKKPDALIEGRVADVYSPSSADVQHVRKEIAKKVGRDQAHRISWTSATAMFRFATCAKNCKRIQFKLE